MVVRFLQNQNTWNRYVIVTKFNSELQRFTAALVANEETKKDYSLIDAKKMIESIEKPPVVKLTEEKRENNVRDINMTVSWGNHCIVVKMIASEQFFSIQSKPHTINGVQVPWTWSPNYGRFSMDVDEETKETVWRFFTALSEVL